MSMNVLQQVNLYILRIENIFTFFSIIISSVIHIIGTISLLYQVYNYDLGNIYAAL
jgi:hypothetical protein